MDLLGLTWLIIIAGAIALVVAWVVTLREQKREADSKSAGIKAG